jgi:hypothetical protein
MYDLPTLVDRERNWPDCVNEVARYQDFESECARVAAGPPLPPANDTGWLR